MSTASEPIKAQWVKDMEDSIRSSEALLRECLGAPYMPVQMKLRIDNYFAGQRAEEKPITDNDRRWRTLEHGCQWVSFMPIGGEDHSFDPRGVPGLQAMRKFADEIHERHMKVLRDAIDAAKRTHGPSTT